MTETEETEKIPADTVIAAVGEKVPTEYYEANGISLDEKGRPRVDSRLGTNVPGVYVIGDGLHGPSLVVKGMAQAMTAAEAVIGGPVTGSMGSPAEKAGIYARKGILREPSEEPEAERCLGCSTVCENCVDVCPNRANISVHVPGMEKEQAIHVDYMCNECGNCGSFCPYDSAPYLDKFTLFAKEADMEESSNDGFTVTDMENGLCRVRYLGEIHLVDAEDAGEVPEGVVRLMETVRRDYPYLVPAK